MSNKDNVFKKGGRNLKDWTFHNKKKAAMVYGGLATLVVAVIVVCVIFGKKSKMEQVVYREETAKFGELTVGVDIDGSVEVGKTTQTLDIDISEYTASAQQMGMPGGQPGMMNMGQSTSSSSSSDSEKRVLKVEDIYVSVGQSISKGDRIAKLTEDSVTRIRSELTEDVDSAQNTYDQTVAQQAKTDQSADSSYSINTMYGSYVQSEYDASVLQLQNDVDDAQETLDEARDSLTTYQEELAADEEKIVDLKALVTNAEYTVSNIDRTTQLYGWLDAENYREEAQSLLDSIEDEIEELNEKIKDQEAKITENEISLGQAKKAYELGVIEAKATYDTHSLYYNNSQEILDVTKLQSALSVEEAKDDLDQAKEKLSEFDTYVVDNEIVSGYNGVISEIDIANGDELYSSSDILVVNDYDDVTVTVDVEDDDIESAGLGAIAKVNIDAFPDTVFDAKVTDIGDATYDDSTGVTSYEVTVTLSGDLSELYSGMTARVTFITKDTESVLYIPNRAVTRKDGVSTVKIKGDNGKMKSVQVETGFSDGVNVEVKSGLSEGDVVIIESSVK